jgi:hypothetical protein
MNGRKEAKRAESRLLKSRLSCQETCSSHRLDRKDSYTDVDGVGLLQGLPFAAGPACLVEHRAPRSSVPVDTRRAPVSEGSPGNT